jgi:hypothetical protein
MAQGTEIVPREIPMPFLARVLAALFALSMVAAPVQAQTRESDLAALDAFKVPEENRFAQVALTPAVVGALLATLPVEVELQSAHGAKLLDIMRADQSFSRTVKIAAAAKEHGEALEAMARKAGFDGYSAFSQASRSLILALDRDRFRTATLPSLRQAEHLREAPVAARIAAGVAIKALEGMISAAQQRPLPENVQVVVPFRREFEALERRSNR